MEWKRLTFRTGMGDDLLDAIAFLNPDDAEGMYNLRDIGKHGSDELLLEIANRLAEYEDTGLEPKEINEKMNEAYDLGAQSALRYKGLTWSEAEELLRYRDAEEQGLLVWLPCKLGDTVWFKTYKNGEYIGIKPHKVEAFRVLARLERGYAEPTTEVHDWEFGKTVFLTEEAAEKALEKALEDA